MGLSVLALSLLDRLDFAVQSFTLQSHPSLRHTGHLQFYLHLRCTEHFRVRIRHANHLYLLLPTVHDLPTVAVPVVQDTVEHICRVLPTDADANSGWREWHRRHDFYHHRSKSTICFLVEVSGVICDESSHATEWDEDTVEGTICGAEV